MCVCEVIELIDTWRGKVTKVRGGTTKHNDVAFHTDSD